MHIPVAPPDLSEIMESPNSRGIWRRMGDSDVVDFVRRFNDGYVHWDKLRRYQHFPMDLTRK